MTVLMNTNNIAISMMDTSAPPTVLLIEDNPGDAALIQDLAHAMIAVTLIHVERLAAGRAYLAAHVVNLILLDLSLPDSRGLDTFFILQAQMPHIPIIVLTGLDDEGIALEALKAGAQDYLVKGHLDGHDLRRSIGYAIKRAHIHERLTTALHEKEVLLKEIHHRIKNNLQVVISLLRIQGREMTDPRSSAALIDSCQRVEMMALAHELLYRTENMTTINAGLYLRQISTQLIQIYNCPPGQVTVSVIAEGIWLSMDQAVPCGLIINELLSNSLKYAFPDGQCGTVGIALHTTPPGMLMLRVWDTGVGFPAGDPAIVHISLGIALVHDLVRQLRGTAVTEHATGVSVTITFPHDLAVEMNPVA